jgi:hypothetical protein
VWLPEDWGERSSSRDPSQPRLITTLPGPIPRSRETVLEDPETGELEENSRQVLVEAYRRVDEAEARVPRVQLLLGDRVTEGRRAIEELRSALKHLSDYIRQPGWGEDWSDTELESAKALLANACAHEQRFLRKARA